MSFVDDLLADLEENEQVEDDNALCYTVQNKQHGLIVQNRAPIPDSVKIGGTTESHSLQDIAEIYRGARLKDAMTKIDKCLAQNESGMQNAKMVLQQDPEYEHIAKVNKLYAEIDEEIVRIHNFAKNKYGARFPELEEIVSQPLDYLMTARELGNTGLLNAKDNKNLQSFLSQATIMVLSVTASITQGMEIGEGELDIVSESCGIAVQLTEYQKKIVKYVESRMIYIAPNLSFLIGASTAAQLIGSAGGLMALSKMPANYVALLGQKKTALAGCSKTFTLSHTGFIYKTDLVQKLSRNIRLKVARVLGSKCALAARVDCFHKQPTGVIGMSFRAEVEKKIGKFQEAPPVKATIALPAPIEVRKHRRGGRRFRKLKEQYALTGLRRQANRINFGELSDDWYQADLGVDRGNIGKSAVGGRVRSAHIDERTKIRVSQTLKKRLERQKARYGASTVRRTRLPGTLSSVCFTPLQGLELIIPNSCAKGAGTAKSKYFSPSAPFVRANTLLADLKNSLATGNLNHKDDI